MVRSRGPGCASLSKLFEAGVKLSVMSIDDEKPAKRLYEIEWSYCPADFFPAPIIETKWGPT
jgi:hypothetical protein